MTDLRKDAQIQRAIVAFWMAATPQAQYEALATALAAAKRNGPLSEAVDEWVAHAHQSLKEPSNPLSGLMGWLRANEGVLGLAALLWVTVWWVGCR